MRHQPSHLKVGHFRSQLQLLGRGLAQRQEEGGVDVGHHPIRPLGPGTLRHHSHLLQVIFRLPKNETNEVS